MHPQKPNRRFQFSLRLLLVAMLLVAAFFGGRASMYPRLHQTRNQLLRAEQQARQEAEKAMMLAEHALMSEMRAKQALVEAEAKLTSEPSR